MLTSFIEERPVKRLKGQPEVYDDSSGNVRLRTWITISFLAF
jgi:hypothetical protein